METKKLLTWGAVILVIYLVYTWYKKTQATAAATPTVQTYYADGTPVIPGLTQAQNEGN